MHACMEFAIIINGFLFSGNPTSNQDYQRPYSFPYNVTTNCTGDELFLSNCSEISQRRFHSYIFDSGLAGIACLAESKLNLK